MIDDERVNRNTSYSERSSSSKVGVSEKDYGPNSQQPDVSVEELDRLCTEFFEREVSVTQRASFIEQQTQQQSYDSVRFQQRRLRLTASNFGKVARIRPTTLVTNLVKGLLYSKPVNSRALRWAKLMKQMLKMSKKVLC